MAKWRTPFSLSTPVWTNLALPTSGAITNGYDTGGRLKGTWLKSGTGAIVNRHTYLYNTYGQPQRHTLADLSYTTYSYDDDAQLTSALGYTSGGVAVAAEQLGFVYDPGWNLTNRSVNGAGITYTVDDRNQLSSVGAVTYSYDAMGNLQTETGGDNRSYTYDNENRLIMVQWGASSYRTEFAYDALSRLRKRTERFLSGGVWTLIGETRYLYDGMQVVQERDGSNVPTVTYTRGKDLSGSLQGAGGIGGMLSRSHGYSAGSWSTHSYYHADGLGNITRLVNSTNGVVGSYKYDAYGRTISSSGALASANVYRFSSKMWFYDGTPGYYYFGYRFYQPRLQRWLNRDPLGEPGAINLYQFVYNSPTLVIDHQGLFGDGRTYGSEADPNSEWFGHSDFAGSQWFDYTLEDHDPATAPTTTGAPANHFQDWTASLQQALQAITDCDAEAFARAMHRLQDYYTHYGKGYRWDPSRGQFGHAHRLHGPDRDNDAWRRANRTTEILLKRWIQQNGEPTWERTSMPESRRSP